MSEVIIAEGDGYFGEFKFTKSTSGWVLESTTGRGFLTPGIGYPMAYPTKEELINAIKQHRPAVKFK